MLRSLSHHHPLLLLLDDLQWVDDASKNLLYHLGADLKRQPDHARRRLPPGGKPISSQA